MSAKNAKKHVVMAAETGMRIDRFARKHFADLPLSAIHRMIREGKLRINDAKVKADYRLVQGDLLDLPVISPAPKPRSESAPLISDVDIKRVMNMIVKDLPEAVVVCKPYGMSSQGGEKVTQSLDRLLATLDKKLGIKTGAAQGCRLVHRLDKETTGLMVLAKDRKAAEHLSAQFREGSVRKTYFALVWGKVPTKGVIHNDLEDAKGNKQSAVTHFERKFVGMLEDQVVSVVAVMPKTGRKHQIRKHFLHINHPLIGDRKYMLPAYKTMNRTWKLQLCAQLLGFQTPQNERVTFTIDLPSHMKNVLTKITCDPHRLLKR